MEPPSAAAAKAEAERLVSIATKLLQSRDLTGAREFAILAQETDPLLDGSDQILAVSDVLLAAEKSPSPDHYAILNLDPTTTPDIDTIRRCYRRLALLLHPDKNPSPFSDSAFRHVSDAWSVLSDPAKKAEYDKSSGHVPSIFTAVELKRQQQAKLPVRRAEEASAPSFWTACPYCYNLYEYLRVYEDCCLRCQNCHHAFHGVTMPSLPPFVPGREAYYCTWNLFPLRSSVDRAGNLGPVNGGSGGVGSGQGFGISSGSNWKPASAPRPVNGLGFGMSSGSGKKRGRPRKYPSRF